MTISEYRQRLGLSQEALAAAIGLNSKGYMNKIERENRCSPKVALAIEEHSRGLVDAASLNDDVALVRKAAA